MKTKTDFAFRVDMWDDAGGSVVEARRWCGRLRGGGGDLPGSSGVLAKGPDHPGSSMTHNGRP
jgi:hypothetical protein